MQIQSEYVYTERENKRKTEENTMKNEGIKRTETYTENKAACYRLPNTTTMENLSMQVSAGEGAVLKMGDKVLVADAAWKGFIAGVYEFVETPEETGLGYIECRLNLIAMSAELFEDGGHAIAWAMNA